MSKLAIGPVVGTFLMMAGEGAINPVLPLFGKALGASVALVGVVIAASGLSRVVFNLPVGRLADVIGRRPLLVYGPLVTLAAALLASASNAVWQLLVLRLLSGVGTAAFMTGSIIVLSDIDDEGDRLKAIGSFRAAVVLGVLLGPVAGGIAGEVGGYRAAFLLQVAVCAASSAWAYLRLPADAPRGSGERDRPPPWWTSVRSVLANRSLVLVSLVTFNIYFTLTGARQAIVPLIAEDRLGLDVGGLGLLFGLISLADLVSLWPASRLGHRFGAKPVIVTSGVVLALSLLAFAAADDTTGFMVAGALMGVGTGLASPTTASYAAGVAPSEGRGSAMGLYQTVGDSGFVVGPLLLGSVAATAGFGAGLLLNAGIAVVVSVLFACLAVSRRVTRADEAVPVDGPA